MSTTAIIKRQNIRHRRDLRPFRHLRCRHHCVPYVMEGMMMSEDREQKAVDELLAKIPASSFPYDVSHLLGTGQTVVLKNDKNFQATLHDGHEPLSLPKAKYARA